MIRLLTLLAIVAGIYSAERASRPAPPDTVQGREESFVKGIKSVAPIAIGSYGSMTGATAKDGNLEIDIQLSASAPQISVDEAFVHGTIEGTCKDPTMSEILRRGGKVSFALTAANGQPLPIAAVPHC